VFAEIKVPHFTQEMEHEVEVGDTIQFGESMGTVNAFGVETKDTVDNETIISKA
jgi:sorbitol-specific phosphotransferase system component IIA